MEKYSKIKLKVVERAGEKVSDILHKSNPWNGLPCDRNECRMCSTGNEKLWGKCKERNVVYENECMICKPNEEKDEEGNNGGGEERISKPSGEKRKIEAIERKPIERKKSVKYIGETSRSGFERSKEHWDQFENLSYKSHMLKHYAESHKDLELKDLKFEMRIVKKYRSSFERQIGESVCINHNLREGTELLNSKNEYNRCIIPRLVIEADEDLEEYMENQREMKLKHEIDKLKIKWRDGKKQPKSKRRKVEKGIEQTKIESMNIKKNKWTKEKLLNIVEKGKLNERLNLTNEHV